MRQTFTTAPMTAAAFAGEAFSCACANGAVCASANTAILLDAAFVASIIVILGILSISLLGLIGLPIFTEGGGLWYVFKPSFGYIIGFCGGTFVTGLLAQRLKKPTVLGYLGANFAGLAVVYVVGMVYYYLICNYVIASPIGLWPLILYCCILAIPGDIALSILAAIVVKRLQPVLGADLRPAARKA